jgi:hypothetical protein
LSWFEVRFGMGAQTSVAFVVWREDVLHGATVNLEPQIALLCTSYTKVKDKEAVLLACFRLKSAVNTSDASYQRVSLFTPTFQAKKITTLI